MGSATIDLKTTPSATKVFLRILAPIHVKVRAGPTLYVVRARDGSVFGVACSSEWKQYTEPYAGGSDSCAFFLHPKLVIDSLMMMMVVVVMMVVMMMVMIMMELLMLFGGFDAKSLFLVFFTALFIHVPSESQMKLYFNTKMRGYPKGLGFGANPERWR